MEEAHIGIQPHTLQGRGTVIGQQTVGEGQHGVDIVQRRTAIAPMEEEILLLAQEHLIEYPKIGIGGGSLQSPQGFQIADLQNLWQQLLMGGTGVLEIRLIDPKLVVTAGALHAPAGVVDLSEDHGAGDACRFHRVIGAAVLGAPQEDIAPADPGGTGQEFPPWRTEAQPHIPLGAGSHQRRRCPRIGKADDHLQIVQWESGDHGLVPVDQDIFSLQTQVCILRSHKQGV